jgi:hypothetical protein
MNLSVYAGMGRIHPDFRRVRGAHEMGAAPPGRPHVNGKDLLDRGSAENEKGAGE